jgi:hypothetical protein
VATQSVRLGSFIYALDAAGAGNKTITEYAVYDTGTGAAASDQLVVGGVAHSAHSFASQLIVSASQFATMTLLAANGSGTDVLSVSAYNGSYWGDWQNITVNIAATPPFEAVAKAISNYTAGAVTSPIAIFDTAAAVSSNLDTLQSIFAAGELSAIVLNDTTPQTFTMTVTQATNDAGVLGRIDSVHSLKLTGISGWTTYNYDSNNNAVSDSITTTAAYASSNIDAINSFVRPGLPFSLILTDSGIPSISISASQLTSDAKAISDIAGYFSLNITAPVGSSTIAGAANALGNTVVFNGNASTFTIAPSGDSVNLVVSSTNGAAHLSKVQALHFNDFTDIVAQKPGTSSVTSGNITELYSAVFGRLPDVAGLTYYENELTANPSLSLTTLAQNFLASPEYVNNNAHAYAQTTAGDTQFITDLYQNLLHRPPASGDAAWYEANVITPIVGNATPGSAAYNAAVLQAHAVAVTDFSASAEFLGNVQVTAAHPADANHWLVLI